MVRMMLLAVEDEPRMERCVALLRAGEDVVFTRDGQPVARMTLPSIEVVDIKASTQEGPIAACTGKY